MSDDADKFDDFERPQPPEQYSESDFSFESGSSPESIAGPSLGEDPEFTVPETPLTSGASPLSLVDQIVRLRDACGSWPVIGWDEFRTAWKPIADLLAYHRDEPSKPDLTDHLSPDLARDPSVDMANDPANNASDSPVRGIVGDPPKQSAVPYHAECLSTIEWTAESVAQQPWIIGKVHWHLTMLGHALVPTDERFLPIVSVIIPAYEARATIAAAIESCLNQTHPTVEIIVIDDGSTDGTREFVGRYGRKITLLWQNQEGPAAARNLGVSRACGEFVHFLDAGDTLLPGALSEKVRAFANVADARLCFSHVATETDAGQITLASGQVGFEDPHSAVYDSMLAVTSRYPFHASTVMVPRWMIDKVGPFEVDMRRGEDLRFWFRMAMTRLKAVALTEPVTCRPAAAPRQDSDLACSLAWAIEGDLRSIGDLAQLPRIYRYIVPLVQRTSTMMEQAYSRGLPQPELDHFQERLLALEHELGLIGTAYSGGYSTTETNESPRHAGLAAILLDQLLFSLRQYRRENPDLPIAIRLFLDEREGNLLDHINPLRDKVSPSDLRRWLPDIAPQPFEQLSRSQKASLRFALEQLQACVILGELRISFKSLVRVGAEYPGHPYEEFWGGVARLATVVGDEAAKRICRGRFFQYGWQWLGHARRMLRGERVTT